MPTPSDRSNVMTLGALGMLSGAISWGLVHLTKRPEWSIDLNLGWGLEFGPISIYPGFVFGLIIGVLLRRRSKVDGLRQVGYVLAAVLAYFSAVQIAYHVEVAVKDETLIIAGICGGLAGSFLLGLMTVLLVRVSGWSVLTLPVLVGGMAGATLLFVDSVFFPLWQGAYAASLALMLRPTQMTDTHT
jgi:hypothetical protein